MLCKIKPRVNTDSDNKNAWELILPERNKINFGGCCQFYLLHCLSLSFQYTIERRNNSSTRKVLWIGSFPMVYNLHLLSFQRKKNALAWTRSSPKSIGFSLSSETETENTGLTKVYTRSSFLFSLVFLMGLPTVIMSVSLTLVPTLGTLFLLLVCCVQIKKKMIVFASSHYILFCHVCYLLEACSFQMWDRKWVDPEGRGNGEKLGGIERRETAIRIYCMAKLSIFN